LHITQSDSGALQILQNRHGFIDLFAERAQPGNRSILLLRPAVGKIKSRHIHATLQQLRQHDFGIGRRPDGTHDFSAALGKIHNNCSLVDEGKFNPFAIILRDGIGQIYFGIQI